MTSPKKTVERAEFTRFALHPGSAADPVLQDQLEHVDETLRRKYGMAREQTAVGVLDLRTLRIAQLRPDDMMYGASVPKIGILLAFFQRHPEAATNLPAATRRELGQMIKQSSNEIASKFSHELGLASIQ